MTQEAGAPRKHEPQLLVFTSHLESRLLGLFSVRRFATASSATVVALALAVLGSWLAERWELLTIGQGRVPTAPSTALLLLVLSAAVLARVQRPDEARWARVSMGLAWASLAVGLLVVANTMLGLPFSLETWLGVPLHRSAGLIVGRMSPATAIGITCASAALLLRARGFGDRATPRVLAGSLATAVMSMSGTVLIGYAAGAPLLYGSDVVPMAVPTAVGLLLIGAAELALSFREYLSNESPSEASARARATVAFVSLLVVVSISAVMLLREQLIDARRGITAELTAIADEKVSQVSAWRKERLSDGSFVRRTNSAVQSAMDLLRDPRSTRALLELARWTELLGDGHQYDQVHLFDTRTGVQQVVPGVADAKLRALQRRIVERLPGGAVELTSLYQDADGDTHLSLLVPVGARSSGAGTDAAQQPSAIIALEMDASRSLYRLIEAWPTKSRSREVLLVEQSGEDVLFLNEVQFRPDSALFFRRPIRQRELPAARAARGEVGVGDGVDYRGVAVLAATRVIPGSSWRLVLKVDQAEIYAPLRQRALLVGLGLSAFGVAAGLGLSSLWRSRELAARRESETRLRESEARFRDVFESANVGKSITLLDGHVSVNQAYADMLGYERAALESVRWQQLTPPEDVPAIEEHLAQLLDGTRRTARFRKRYVRKDGGIVWADVSTAIRRDAEGEPLYFITTIVDISDRVRSEAALQRSEERFATAFRSSPTGTFISTLDGTYVDVNQAFCDLVGCSRAELIGQRVGILGNASAALRERVIADADQAGGTLRGIEHTIRHRDGSERNILFSTTVIELHGEPHRLSTCLDVTEHRLAEAQVRLLNAELERRIEQRTAQLLVSNQELEAFAYSVSHDLRAPLRAVDGYVNILVEDYGARLDEEGRRLCGVIGASARNLGRLIDELLSYSRTARVEMRRVRLDMAAMAEAVFQSIVTPEDRSRVEFTVDPLPPANGDATLLRQVWANLLDNALKFSHQRERAVIHVGWRPAPADQASRGEAGAYFVRDNGAGFDMRYADKLFGMFQRLHSETAFPGSGVGLALVARVLHRHGGRVWAESALDEGATFYFTLGGEA